MMKDNKPNDHLNLIYAYTRAQAIEDGVLIDATQGDFADISRQHYKYPIAMTTAVYALIEKAVHHPRWCNDVKGVWHDILWMSRVAARSLDESTRLFQVIITGTGRKRTHTLKIVCGPGDEGEPVLTVMLPNED
ncbi:MAG: hypothetical protein JW709_00365 [Sedimentisphaerales bacterium]|nr:hypothetical protein [Sedimentisphaerales bacterium]